MVAKNSKIIKPAILCLSDFYVPDFRAGGLVRSVSNFVELLGDDFDIKIICRGCNVQDIKLFKRIKPDSWNVVGKAKVFYVSNKNLKTFFIINLIRQTSHDILYLNSFFSYQFSILPLLTRFFSHNLNQPCVISPRGELSEQALLLKKYKKSLFIKFSRLIKLHGNLIWLAGRNIEYLEIYKVFDKYINSKDELICVDVTGSMTPYYLQVLVWLQLKNSSIPTNFSFFNLTKYLL